MNLSIFKIAKRLSLLASFLAEQLLVDPNGLFTKATERMRTTSFPFVFPQIPSPSPRAETLLESGEISAALRTFRSGGVRGKLRAFQVERQLVELETTVRTSVVIRPNHERRNILFYLTNSLPYTQSGYTERTQKVLSALQERGISVRAVTRLNYPLLIGKFIIEPKVIVDGIAYHFLLPWKSVFSADKRLDLAVKMLVHEATRFNADVIHTTTDYKNAIVASRAAAVLGIPWIYEVRGELQKTWLSKRLHEYRLLARHSEFYEKATNKENEAMQRANSVIALSQVAKEQYVSRGIKESKITIVPNAIAANEIGMGFVQSDLRSELQLPEGFIIGTVTSVVSYEGLDDLLRSVALLDGVICLIVGDGEAKPTLELLAMDLGIQDRVIFAGKRSPRGIWKWYAAMDIFVAPRKNYEVCRSVTPIKTLRAQALGVMVITSDLPALKDVTGGLAFYAPPEDPLALAAKISQVKALNRRELQRVRDEGIQWVASRTWEANAGKLARVYNDL